MKKLLVVLVVFAFVVCAGSAFALSIKNSKHDLSSGSATTGPKSTTINEICIFCHTPHNADSTAGMPLWNRSASLTTSYNVYTGVSHTWTGNGTNQPGPVSKACLSCHDGTLAFDALRNVGGAQGANSFSNQTGVISGAYLIAEGGTNLTNDHPIGFDPMTAIYTTGSGTDYIVQNTLPLFDNGSGTKQLECATCHMVHDNQFGHFLRMDNTGSALCLTCHNK